MPIAAGGNFQPDRNIVSPGVFTREIDQSGVAQGVASIGAVIVAPFAQGPGFSPTIVNSIASLQAQFGVPDGKLYGPYCAQQYLQEKGFVTVCRVGALTGYEQNYPYVLWAENGVWLRNGDIATIDPSSTVSQPGITFHLVNSNAISGSTAFGYTGSVNFLSQSVSINLDGSLLYNGATITGYINGSFPFTGSLNLSTASVTTSSILTELLLEHKLSGSLAGGHFIGTDPFDTALWINQSISQSVDLCNNVIINLDGQLTGSFGNYNGNFLSGSGTFDPCTGTWNLSNTQYKVLAVLADTQNATINSQLQSPGFLGSALSYAPSPSGSDTVGLIFNLALSQSLNGGYGVYNFSFNPNDTSYITNVFGNNAQVGDPSDYVPGTKIEASYLYSLFQDDINIVSSNPAQWRINGTAMPSGSWTGQPLNFTDEYSLAPTTGDSTFSLTNAYTPFVVSQQIAPWNGGTPHRYELFQFFTLSDGTYTNQSIKIEISNVKLAGTVAGTDWGTFSVIVRKYSDTDKKTIILEQFNNLTLDPTDPNFIARAIGDQYNYISFTGKIYQFGIYENLSNYIRVAISTNNYPITAVPYGFEAYTTPIAGAMGQHCSPVAYTKASVYGLSPGKYPSGIDFNGPPAGSDAELSALYPTSSFGNPRFEDNLQYFVPVPSGATVGSNIGFALDDETVLNGVGTGSYIEGSNSVPAIYDASNEAAYVKMRSFVFGFQGGFDGQSPSIDYNIGRDINSGNTQGLNCATSTTAGSVAYNQCIGALSNADEFDINLIVTPGIIYSLHSYVTNLVVEMCENRGDCFYIADLYQDNGNPDSGQIDNVVDLAAQFDTSYAGTYYPWIVIKDTNINQLVTIPPSVILPAVYANNDNVAGEWWAAAGLNRGGIPLATQVTDRTTQPDRDVLYEGKVNPIAAFPGQGIVVWGQKTLQNADSALNRINVRRLLIEIKKFFASTSKYLVFEQNTSATWNKFLSITNPYLESIQQRSGLYAFQITMDSTTNTADLIDQNIMYGKIGLQPTKTSEMILLDFSILPTGATFSN